MDNTYIHEQNNKCIFSQKEKSEIRKRILKKRRQLSKDFLIQKSKQIVEQIYNHPFYKDATHICLYMPIQNEIDVTLMFDKILSDGKKIFLPRILNNIMDFYFYDRTISFVIGAYGISEPNSNDILIPDDNTLVVCPGSVFSKKGDRIGYGGGFYDKYLSKYPMVKTIAVAYEFQIFDEIPCESTDYKMDYCISEEHIYQKGE